MIGSMTVLTLAGRKLFARSSLSFAGLAVAFVLAFPAAAQIPALLNLSPGVTAAHPELVQERATLVADRQVLRSRTGTQNAQCSSVTEGSALEATCRNSLSRLNADVSAHIAKSNSFNAAVRQAESDLAPADNSNPSCGQVASLQSQFSELNRRIGVDRQVVRNFGFDETSEQIEYWGGFARAAAGAIPREIQRNCARSGAGRDQQGIQRRWITSHA